MTRANEPMAVPASDCDAFVIFTPNDEDWVYDKLWPYLEGKGLLIATKGSRGAARPGILKVDSFTQGIERAKRTIVVVSPDFVETDYMAFETSFAMQVGIDHAQYRLIPFIYRPTEHLPTLLGALVPVDYTHKRNGGERALNTLANAIAAPVPVAGWDIPVTARAKNETIKILFLAANPVGTKPLQLDAEAGQIAERLQRTRNGDQFTFEKVFAARRDELIECIQEHEPSVVHFSGHGSTEGELVFETQDGQSAPILIPALGEVFRILAPKGIRFVVLNACYSEAQGRAIAEHVDCVIGMGRAVLDSAATQFASQLYSSLGYGSSIDEAFRLACAQLDLTKIPGSDTPRLLPKKGVDPARLTLSASAGLSAKELGR